MAPPAPAPYQIRVVGAARTPLRDAYHAFLRMPWWLAIALITIGYLALNALFAVGYLLAGGVHGARPGSFYDVYCFSVQTMGTIGYGAMYPVGRVANALMIAESVAGLLVMAVATGLVFAKFSRSTARVAFTRRVAISPVDGVPALQVRVGNERGNRIVEAQLHLILVRTERSREGAVFYRSYELKLVRDRSPALTRSQLLMHLIDDESPLAGKTPADLAADETELLVTVIGFDDTTVQTVHAQHRYMAEEITWGARHADVLSETTDGHMLLDLRKFHELEPTAPAPDFPYPPRSR